MSTCGSLEGVFSFIQEKTRQLTENSDSLGILQQVSKSDFVQSFVNGTATSSAMEGLATSPLMQLGKDFLAEQISKNGNQLMNNITKKIESEIDTQLGVPFRKTIQDAHNLVFNTIGAALTIHNDMSMFFLQDLASGIMEELTKKDQITKQLQEKLRHLYNALVILVAGNPFFSKYLENLRGAIKHLDAAQKDFTIVKNTYDATDLYLKIRMESGKKKLESAVALLEPAPQKVQETSFNVEGLLKNIGIPSESQQLTVMLSIPQLSKDCLFILQGYITSTLRINGLLIAFKQGYQKFTKSSSSRLKQYTLDSLTMLETRTGSLADRMGSAVNGIENSVPLRTTVQSGFTPDSVLTSASTIPWLLELKAIVEYSKIVPGPSAALEASNNALAAYYKAVEDLAKLDSMSSGVAHLTAVDGTEEPLEVSAKAVQFLLKANFAIVSGTASKEVLALGSTLISRLDLTLKFDAKIYAAVSTFANAELGLSAALKDAGKSIYSLMDSFGMDRAKALLKGGGYEDFFNVNAKTATYAGAALVGLAALKGCVTTVEDRQHLDQAERLIQRENSAKNLSAQRGALDGFEQQMAKIELEIRNYQKIGEQAEGSSAKCDEPCDNAAANVIKLIGPILGISLLANGSVGNAFKKLGKGLF